MLKAFWAAIAVAVLLSVLIPAPLEPPADPLNPPNPARSAWFLLWIQEMVSWSGSLFLLIPLLVLLVLFLPFCRRHTASCAGWFLAGDRSVQAGAVLLLLFILALTGIGFLFRGEEWAFVLPF